MDIGISVAYTAISAIVNLAKQVKTNKSNCAVLARRVCMLRPLLESLQRGSFANRSVVASSLISLNEALSHAVEVVRNCQSSSAFSLLWNSNKITDNLNDCLQDIEHSLNGLNLANLHVASDTHKLLAAVREELKDTKLVVSAEDKKMAEELRNLMHEQRQDSHAIKSQLVILLGGIEDLSCLKADMTRMSSMMKSLQARSQSTDKEEVELNYLTQIIGLLEQQTTAGHRQPEAQPLESFMCPISFELMRDPVIIDGSGQTCDRGSAEHWFGQGHKTCPITGVRLSSIRLTSNYALRGAVEDWLRRHPRSLSSALGDTSTTPAAAAQMSQRHIGGSLPNALSKSLSAPIQVQAPASSTPISPEDEVLLRSRGDARKLCALLKLGKSASIQEKALSALRTMAVDGQCAAVAEAGAIEEMVRLLHDGTSTCKERAADVLRILARSSTALQAAIASAGAIVPVVGLLQTGTPTCQQHAAKAVANLARSNDENKEAISRAGAIEPLVALLDSADAPECKLAATRSLRSLTSHARVAADFKVGAIAALVAVLGDDRPACQEDAARALGNLARHVADHRVAIARAGAIPALVVLLDSSTPTCQDAAIDALGNIARANPANKVLISRAGAIRPLVALLGTTSTPDCKLAATWALANLSNCNDSTVSAAFLEAGAVAALKAVQDREPRCRATAAFALKTLGQ